MTDANTKLLHTLTYLRDAAHRPTLTGRAAEAVGGRNMSIYPPHTSRKWLRTNDFGARVALWRVSLSHTRNEFFTLYIINNLN